MPHYSNMSRALRLQSLNTLLSNLAAAKLGHRHDPDAHTQWVDLHVNLPLETVRDLETLLLDALTPPALATIHDEENGS